MTVYYHLIVARLLFQAILLIIVHIQVANSQGIGDLSTTNPRAKRAFENGIHYLNIRNYTEAERKFMEAVRLDPQFIEAFIILGEIFQAGNDHKKAVEAFSEAVKINPYFFPNAIFYLANSQYLTGLYTEAYENVKIFASLQGISAEMRILADDLAMRAEFAQNAFNNPVAFEPVNLGVNVNSRYDEYAPILTVDERTLIFTRLKPHTGVPSLRFTPHNEDFYLSQKKDGEWMLAENPGPPLNTLGNEGAQSISADGMHLYFTACNRPDGVGSCDIYYSYRVGNEWSVPVNLGFPVNTQHWDSQPSIAPDGRTLYFVSNRPGGIGEMDIWRALQLPDGRWTSPQPLGPEINTTGREMSPFIHLDNRTLFFASNGHPGMGRMDLFYSVRLPDGGYSKPINLGFPINTHADEISLVVAASGTDAYFASEKEGGFGGSDIYHFKLYGEAQPPQVTFLKGLVYDAYTNERIKANFELIDLKTGDIIIRSTSDPITGEFLVPIPLGSDLALNVASEGYLFFSDNFSYSDKRSGADPHLYNIPLQPIKVGESVVLRNIFFYTGSYELKPESIIELERLYAMLVQNPDMKLEISGHTDNVGSFEFNLQLSNNRARSVYFYLSDKGIDKSRLSYKGYADLEPVADNNTEEGRAKNRRTEFRILSYN